jgi:hypothetical protein
MHQQHQQHRHHGDHRDAIVDHASPFSPGRRASRAWFATAAAHHPQLSVPERDPARQQRSPAEH